MRRDRHPKKEVEEAIQHAEEEGWSVIAGGRGHAWGKLYCPYNDKECRCGDFCKAGIWSTPKNAGTHARHLKRIVDNCTTHRRVMEDLAKKAESK